MRASASEARPCPRSTPGAMLGRPGRSAGWGVCTFWWTANSQYSIQALINGPRAQEPGAGAGTQESGVKSQDRHATHPSYSPTLSCTKSRSSSGRYEGRRAVVKSICFRNIRHSWGKAFSFLSTVMAESLF